MYLADYCQVMDLLGEPVQGQGGQSHAEYEHAGDTYIRFKYYIKGSRGYGTVQMELKKPKVCIVFIIATLMIVSIVGRQV